MEDQDLDSGGAETATTGTEPLPTVRASRLREPIVDQLRDLIVIGSLAPGSVLRQQELAERLGVSRTPLREALLYLEREGLVESRPGGLTTVVELDPEAARDALEVREMLHGLVARLWAQRGLPEALLARLQRITRALERSVAEADPESHQIGNADFHLLLLHGLNNRWLDQFATLERLSSQATFQRLRAHPAHLRRSAGRHRALLRAIQARDPDAAEAVARSHIREAIRHWELAPDRPGAGPGPGQPADAQPISTRPPR